MFGPTGADDLTGPAVVTSPPATSSWPLTDTERIPDPDAPEAATVPRKVVAELERSGKYGAARRHTEVRSAP